MGRKYFDCRDFPGGAKCSVALSADTVDELLEAVVRHNISIHGENHTVILGTLYSIQTIIGVIPILQDQIGGIQKAH